MIPIIGIDMIARTNLSLSNLLDSEFCDSGAGDGHFHREDSATGVEVEFVDTRNAVVAVFSAERMPVVDNIISPGLWRPDDRMVAGAGTYFGI